MTYCSFVKTFLYFSVSIERFVGERMGVSVYKEINLFLIYVSGLPSLFPCRQPHQTGGLRAESHQALCCPAAFVYDLQKIAPLFQW